jgi:thioredoxin 1
MVLRGYEKMKKFGSDSRPLVLLLLISIIFVPGRLRPGQSGSSASPQNGEVLVTNNLELDFSKHKVTFIELGADRCIPCKAMQPIMQEIAREYAGKIQVVFYDVWKDPAPARKYGIQLIPTQVFVDQSGQEIFRHVGFFAKEEMLSMLKEKGII